MKNLVISIVISIFVLFLTAQNSWSQDPVKVSPDVYKVLEDNCTVRILEMKMKPGGADKMHSHPGESVYFVNACKLKITLPDNSSMELEIPAGHVMWHEEWTHQVSNIGATDVHAIITEVKKPMAHGDMMMKKTGHMHNPCNPCGD